MDVEAEPKRGSIMNPDLEKLIYLQTVDSNIARKENLLKTLPEEISRYGKTTESAEKALKDFDEETDGFSKQRRELESEVEDVKVKIANSKTKLPTVKTNVEYRAILKEEQTLGKMIDNLEEKQLELMEKQDGRAEQRVPLEQAFKNAQSEFQVIRKEKEAAMEKVKTALEKLNTERKELVASVTPSIFRAYEKALKARQGVGVAQVANMLCQGCNQLIPPAEYYSIKSTDKLHKCPHCNRFLYHKPEENEN